jgi:integrase
MPKEITPLSELQVKAIKPKVKADGTLDVDKTAVGGCPGLYLYTQPAGTKTWVLRAILNGKRVEFGLGSYATRASTQRKKASGKTETALTLKAARVKGMAWREQIADGIDPRAEKKRRRSELAAAKAGEMTFAELAESYVDKKAAEWKTIKQVRTLKQFLADHINPHVGEILVKDLEPEHFISMLKPIYTKIPPTAKKIIRHCEQIVNLGIVLGLRPVGNNPARWESGLDVAFPAYKKVHKEQHHPSVDWRLMPEFMQKLFALDTPSWTKPEVSILALQILTVSRPSEARLARWEDFSIEDKCWHIPDGSERDLHKASQSYRVPLTPLAIKILKAAGPKESGRIWSIDKGTQVPDPYVSCIPKMLGYNADAHGMRGTFRTWIQEPEAGRWSDDAVRITMKHSLKDKVTAAYAKGDCYEERAKLLKAWEDWITKAKGHTADVIPMRRRASK